MFFSFFWFDSFTPIYFDVTFCFRKALKNHQNEFEFSYNFFWKNFCDPKLNRKYDFFSYIMKKLMKNECHRRKYPDLSCFHTKNEEIFAIFAPEISTFDAPTWHSTSQLFDGRLLKTSIPLKSQNHVLSFNNFKCQWNGLNIFVTIVDTKTSLLLKSGIDGNSIITNYT